MNNPRNCQHFELLGIRPLAAGDEVLAVLDPGIEDDVKAFFDADRRGDDPPPVR